MVGQFFFMPLRFHEISLLFLNYEVEKNFLKRIELVSTHCCEVASQGGLNYIMGRSFFHFPSQLVIVVKSDNPVI